jgi:hypothetical protein
MIDPIPLRLAKSRLIQNVIHNCYLMKKNPSLYHRHFQHEHPNPGQQYQGIRRACYLPNNEGGRLVAKLLNVAFSRRLVFTIGRSRTTGQDGVITWNDILHKTRPTGGPQR